MRVVELHSKRYGFMKLVFSRFRKEERQLPVLWHQSLLAFAQRYKNDINDEQRAALLELTKVSFH